MKHASILALTLLACAASDALAQQGAPTPNAIPPALRRQLIPAEANGAAQRAAVIRTDALVKVNTTYQGWNTNLPWQKESPGSRRGLGVILAGNRVLVTGQMVADATYIELELPDGGTKLPAKVVAVDYEANLALIASAEDNDRSAAFFKGLKPMEIEPIAHVGDMLNIWQTGRVGDLIVTPLRVGKVLLSSYVLRGTTFLVYEGQGIVRSEANSFTLPVVKGGKLAGLLLNYDAKNQVTTVQPGVIIEHFLKDVEDGKYEGFPTMGVEFQTTLDEQFRDYLGLKPGQGGMYISSVTKGGTADALGIQKGDILLNINGQAIDARGDYQDKDFGSLGMGHLVRGKNYVGDPISVTVLREGKEQQLTGKLARKDPRTLLVWPYLFDRGVNYLVSGGLIFQELTRPYLQSFGTEANSTVLRLAHIADHPEEYEEKGLRRIVVLTAVLPTPATQGYERLGGIIVTRANGLEIKDLADLEAALKQPKDGIHTVEFEDYPHAIHLDAIAVERDNMALLSGPYRISSLKRIE